MNDLLPNLQSIKHPRHPGVTSAVCSAFSEAAEVCLYRHHSPIETELEINCCGERNKRRLQWNRPSEMALRAWHNKDDATRDGAYIVSLAVVDSELGLVALSRAETRTGADYYVGEPHAFDLESAYRLEVSGLDIGNESSVRRRLREKIKQTIRGNSNLPALASVVGFQEALVLLEEVEGE